MQRHGIRIYIQNHPREKLPSGISKTIILPSCRIIIIYSTVCTIHISSRVCERGALSKRDMRKSESRTKPNPLRMLRKCQCPLERHAHNRTKWLGKKNTVFMPIPHNPQPMPISHHTHTHTHLTHPPLHSPNPSPFLGASLNKSTSVTPHPKSINSALPS